MELSEVPPKGGMATISKGSETERVDAIVRINRLVQI